MGVTTWTDPLVAPVGTWVLISVGETTVKFASVPLKVTPVAPVRSVPRMSTCWPALANVGSVSTKAASPKDIVALLMSLPLSIRLNYAALAQASSSAGRLAAHPTRILEKVLLYTAISIPLAFGEEFGWRGYAQGKLVRGFGLVKGLLLLGIIWGFWHTPIYYFMGTYPNHPILGPFAMTPIDNILAVVPMGWLYIRSRNIWVPTLMHAFADVLWGFSGLIFPATQEVRSWAVLQAVQLIVSIVLLIDLKTRAAGDLVAGG